MNSSTLPGFSVHGILQARTLERVATKSVLAGEGGGVVTVLRGAGGPIRTSLGATSKEGQSSGRKGDWTGATGDPWCNSPSKEQVSFNFMAGITICSDFGAQKK